MDIHILVKVSLNGEIWIYIYVTGTDIRKH